MEMKLKFKPKFDKIIELLLYLAHKRPDADQYQTVKFFYLADKEHFNRFGRPITFETYFALEYGPVASHVLNLLKDYEPAKKAFHISDLSELPFEIQKLDKLRYIRSPKRAVNYDLFSKSDIAVFDEILSKYGDCTFSQLYQMTHSHFAYKNAWEHKGTHDRALMNYEDMLDESPKKPILVDDLEGVAPNMR